MGRPRRYANATERQRAHRQQRKDQADAYALLVIDPIQAFLGDLDMHRSNETRPVLQALGKLIERHNVTALCIRHPAKSGQGGGKAIYRGLGSIDFIGAGRSGLFVEQHPVDANAVLIAHMKSNVGPLGRTQLFTKTEGVFAWAGISRMTAELVAGNARGPDPLAFFEAYCWLESALKSGLALPSQDLCDEASEEGIGEKTLKRAKKALGIRSHKQGDVWYWQLPALPVLSPPPSPQQPAPLCPSCPSWPSWPSSKKSISYEGARHRHARDRGRRPRKPRRPRGSRRPSGTSS